MHLDIAKQSLIWS